MKRNLVVVLIAITTAALTVSGAALAVTPAEAAARALAWLQLQQNTDGGFGSGFGPGSAVGPTADAILAITSGGQDVSAWAQNGQSPLDYLRAQASAGAIRRPGEIAKSVLAVIAAGRNPRAFGGRDLVADLQSLLDPTTGTYSSSMYDQALAILALSNAGQPIPAAAVEALLRAQTIEGGWAFTGETAAGAADSNTTAVAVQALVAAGRRDDTGRALDYFRRVQNADAGWTYQVPSPFGTETDANSTALGIQVILATDSAVSAWAVSGSDPLGALLSLQNDDGSFSFNRSFPGPNALATLQAIPALHGDTLVRVTVVPASDAGAAAVLLPEAGGAIDTWPLIVAGAVLMAAAFLLRRRVRET